MKNPTCGPASGMIAIALGALVCSIAAADVTVQEKTTLNALVVKLHGTTTQRIAGDKERSETEFHCDGFMSMFCGKNSSVDIVRLDRNVTWLEEPKKKRYTETTFPTPEERRAAAEHATAVMEKLKSCPSAPSAQAPVDTSNCEVTSPIAIKKTDEVAQLAGHDARRASITMTQSCKNKSTGDVCDLAYSFDVWLTTDELPGTADRTAFAKAYARKLGMNEMAEAAHAEVGQFLAPYSAGLKDLSAKAAELKGYPLKSTFRLAFGGAHCAVAPGGAGAATGGVLPNAGKAAADATASSTGSAAGWAARDAVDKGKGGTVGGYVAESAVGAFAGNLVGGLFAKKKKPDEAAASSAATSGVPDSMRTLAEMTIETTAMSTETIQPDQFEVPADWQKVVPKPVQDKEMPSCPKVGG